MFGYSKLITDLNVLNSFNVIKNIQRDSIIEINEELKNHILTLWHDPSIIQTIDRRNEFQVNFYSYFMRIIILH